jgi:hypothetical protein
VRLAQTAIATTLAAICAYLTLAFGIASLGVDGTWLDLLGALVYLTLAAGCCALIPRRPR